MLYSEENKIVFVHIQKTGGSTISNLLNDNVVDIKEIGNKHDWALWGRPDIRLWDSCFKFCFVRNPWERLLSWYSMIVQNRVLLESSKNKMWSYLLSSSNDFPSFIKNCEKVIDDYDGRKSFSYNQVDYIADKSGNILVDYIGRFESFNSRVSSNLCN